MKIYIPMMSQPAGTGRSQTSRGLLLGPQGSTLRALTAESRCQIKLRGKGSGTEGKPLQTADDPGDELHVLVEYTGTPSGRDAVADPTSF